MTPAERAAFCDSVPAAYATQFGSEEAYRAFATIKTYGTSFDDQMKAVEAALSRDDLTPSARVYFLDRKSYSTGLEEGFDASNPAYIELAGIEGLAPDRRRYYQNIAALDPDEGLPESGVDAAPLVRVPPIFPPRFLQGDNSGHCHVAFDVDTTGQPINIDPIYCTDDILRKETIKAVGKWRYSPKVVAGEFVIREDVNSRITYDLRDECGRPLPEHPI